MQIGPPLGNSRGRVIRSLPLPKRKKPRVPRGFCRELVRMPYFSEATGPFDAAGSGSKPNTPTRYL